MKFRTELDPTTSHEKITLQTPVLTVGSCFADTIGNKFVDNKFQVQCNPFGVIYNPLSILQLLAFSIDRSYPPPSSYVQRDELSFNYFFHSTFSSPHPDELKKQIEDRIDAVHDYLASCNWIIISLGTAWVYQRRDNQEFVANCHKMPDQQFQKILLSRKLVLEHFERIYQKLNRVNPDVRILLTVSPVRHLRDTLELNQVSKSTLRLICHTLELELEKVSYFPSYELMIDDLRDYRFYDQDMIHPSVEAVEYIWQKFGQSYLDEQAAEFIQQWTKLRKAIAHRPFNQDTQKHQTFLKKTLEQLESLPFPVDLSPEINQIKSQIS